MVNQSAEVQGGLGEQASEITRLESLDPVLK